MTPTRALLHVILLHVARALALPRYASEVIGNGEVLKRWHIRNNDAPARVGGGGAARGFGRAATSLFVPSTLTAPEYGRYQRWHVAQDLSTQLRSALATSAVFAGLGLGGTAASSAAAATVAWLARDASGMVASLAATSRLAPALDGDARRWRFFGDLCVDAALLCEIATPHAPRACFLPLLCAASVLKALCGVAAGGANAAVAAHWAASSADYAEVAAKGAAIGTVSGLAGLGLSLAATVAVDRRAKGAAAGAKAAASLGLYGVLTALHVVSCGRGLACLALDKLGCPRRFDVVVDAFERTGFAPSPAELAKLDRVAGTPDGGGRAAPSAFLRAWRRQPARVAAAVAAAGGRYVAVPGRVALLEGASPRDERAALLHGRALRGRRDLWRLAPEAFAAAVAAAAPGERAVDALDAALAAAGYDLGASVLPADAPRLRLGNS